jgi:hypothetical protein
MVTAAHAIGIKASIKANVIDIDIESTILSKTNGGMFVRSLASKNTDRVTNWGLPTAVSIR